jgi:hypothetical protein
MRADRRVWSHRDACCLAEWMDEDGDGGNLSRAPGRARKSVAVRTRDMRCDSRTRDAIEVVLKDVDSSSYYFKIVRWDNLEAVDED